MRSRLDEITDLLARAEASRYKVSVTAGGCGVGPRQFERYFRAKTGSSPKKVFNTHRLVEALTNLRSGKSVKQAAAQAGFASAQHFSKAFKEFFGISPSSVPVNHSLTSFSAFSDQNPLNPS
jgi:transcriptional regulator GlxA family with amidase domain